jgi:hypothetical protein
MAKRARPLDRPLPAAPPGPWARSAEIGKKGCSPQRRGAHRARRARKVARKAREKNPLWPCSVSSVSLWCIPFCSPFAWPRSGEYAQVARRRPLYGLVPANTRKPPAGPRYTGLNARKWEGHRVRPHTVTPNKRRSRADPGSIGEAALWFPALACGPAGMTIGAPFHGLVSPDSPPAHADPLCMGSNARKKKGTEMRPTTSPRTSGPAFAAEAAASAEWVEAASIRGPSARRHDGSRLSPAARPG